MIPEGCSNEEDYIIAAAREFCSWVSGQSLENVSYVYWSILFHEDHREERELLWSAWSWTDWTPKPRAPPYSENPPSDEDAVSNLRKGLKNLETWINTIHLGLIYNAGRLAVPNWGEVMGKGDLNEFVLNNEVSLLAHVLCRMWWLHN